MRNIMKFLSALSLAVLSSCSSSPFTFVTGRSWTSGPIAYPTSIALVYPDVDRQSAAASIEGELSRLAPLLFMEHGLPVAGDGIPADFMAEVRAVEREFTAGWKTQRSTILEIIVRRAPALVGSRPDFVVASRASAQGAASLSSSRDLYRLLDKAVQELAVRLRKARREG